MWAIRTVARRPEQRSSIKQQVSSIRDFRLYAGALWTLISVASSRFPSTLRQLRPLGRSRDRCAGWAAGRERSIKHWILRGVR